MVATEIRDKCWKQADGLDMEGMKRDFEEDLKGGLDGCTTAETEQPWLGTGWDH